MASMLRWCHPHVSKTVITVGAVDDLDAEFSNWGPNVDYWFDISDIHSATASSFSPQGALNDYEVPPPGTSYAAPIVSGLVANILSMFRPIRRILLEHTS